MNNPTRYQRRRTRNAVLLTVALAVFAGLIGAAYAGYISEQITLNRIAGSCTDPQIRGFIVRGQIFRCRPDYRQPLAGTDPPPVSPETAPGGPG
ncbi:MAG: hypothetical protein U5P41_07320 [Gammaproteobacteria bacterium]|nr:hypothetical protein [Gammaproteobacteria bacterium]